MHEIHQHWMDDPDYDVAVDYEEVLSGWTKASNPTDLTIERYASLVAALPDEALLRLADRCSVLLAAASLEMKVQHARKRRQGDEPHTNGGWLRKDCDDCQIAAAIRKLKEQG